MEAVIHSKDILKGTKGVTLRVRPDDWSVSVSENCLILEAIENEVISSSDLSGSGPVQEIVRQLKLTVTAEELAKIFHAALRANLLRVDIAAN